MLFWTGHSTIFANQEMQTIYANQQSETKLIDNSNIEHNKSVLQKSTEPKLSSHFFFLFKEI